MVSRWAPRLGRPCVPVLVCALAAHALLYRSLLPNDEVHGYLTWYVPVVGALSAVAVGAVAVLFVSGLLGRRSRLSRLTPPLGRSGTRRFASVGLPAAVFLAAQETLEHSLEAGRLETGLNPAGWLLLLLAVAAVAGLLSILARSCTALLTAVLSGRDPPFQPPVWSASWHRSRDGGGRRRGVLAEPGGERAPPFATC
jgi:hypothetical protein